MGLSWTQGSPLGFERVWTLYLDTFQARLQNAMEKVIKQAVQDAKDFTASRPGAKTGKAGRIESTKMMEQIIGRSYREGVGQVVGEFGFLNGPAELYMMLQTSTGFRHWLSGDFIEPTFALRDAARIAIINLYEEMKG